MFGYHKRLRDSAYTEANLEGAQYLKMEELRPTVHPRENVKCIYSFVGKKMAYLFFKSSMLKQIAHEQIIWRNLSFEKVSNFVQPYVLIFSQLSLLRLASRTVERVN